MQSANAAVAEISQVERVGGLIVSEVDSRGALAEGGKDDGVRSCLERL